MDGGEGIERDKLRRYAVLLLAATAPTFTYVPASEPHEGKIAKTFRGAHFNSTRATCLNVRYVTATVSPRGRYARYATLLRNRCDFRERVHASRPACILQDAQPAVRPCAPVGHREPGAHAHTQARLSINDGRVDGGINLNFRCHP